ncbi:MAG: ATP-binding cassette domain-containing protein [Myxococcota bacterium]|jgi:ABC-type multidrug transport system ATPase subunit|nr:ATP-binding cassette domain-containing protein [Myxococcota bacterium]
MLEITELKARSRGDRRERGPLSLTVRPGEIVHLTGPGGCGKSLLLLALAGRVPGRGEVRWQGTPWAPARRRDPGLLGLLTPRSEVADEALTVQQIINISAGLHGLPRARAATALDRWGLRPMATCRLAWLPASSEERLRLLLLELAEPRLLLLDHPLALLDEEGRRLLDGWLDRLRGSQGGVIWTGPTESCLRRVTDRVVALGALGETLPAFAAEAGR